MHIADEVQSPRRTFRFKTLSTLARQIAGKSGCYKVEHSNALVPPSYFVMILKPTPKDGYNVITRVRVEPEAVPPSDRPRN